MRYSKPDGEGQPALAAHYREIWCVDFEFRADPGERPSPVCMVAREFRSGRELRLWRSDLLQHSRAPFHVGQDALFVAFFASAEIGCFLELGWPVPANILDLYAEHRVLTNGRPILGNSLIGALALRGIATIDADLKDRMRDLILTERSWSADQRQKILEYCAADVRATGALLQSIASAIDLPRALLRGRYAVSKTDLQVIVGATWTTDAPFRETAEAIAAAKSKGILAVEMEAAALYSFASASKLSVLCLAHVTNTMGQTLQDFEKGAHDGTADALTLLGAIASLAHSRLLSTATAV